MSVWSLIKERNSFIRYSSRSPLIFQSFYFPSLSLPVTALLSVLTHKVTVFESVPDCLSLLPLATFLVLVLSWHLYKCSPVWFFLYPLFIIFLNISKHAFISNHSSNPYKNFTIWIAPLHYINRYVLPCVVTTNQTCSQPQYKIFLRLKSSPDVPWLL